MSRQRKISMAGRCTLDLRLADCLDGMNGLNPGSVDVIVTSPPYNIGIRYNSYDDNRSRGEYLDWIGRWCEAALRVLSGAGSVFFNVGGKPSDPWTPLEIAHVFKRKGFFLQNSIHWIKAVTIEKEDAGAAHELREDFSVGHYKPINSRRYLNDTHEYIFHFTRGGGVELDRLAIGVPYQDKSNVARWAGGGGGLRCRGNCWFIPYETIKFRDRDRPHPSTFPPKLAELCIRLHGIERSGLVLDPFMGIGSAALACAKLGVDFLGFEIDPGYFGTAVERAERESKGRA